MRGALLIAIAIAANLGGMATPIGSGPNAIAISAMPTPVSFAHWMSFAVPLACVMLVAAFAAIVLWFGVRGGSSPAPLPPAPEIGKEGRLVIIVVAAAIVLWLAEPLHGIPAAVIALSAATVFFAAGLLPSARIGTLDWTTLIMIAGGIGFGRLLEHTGLLTLVSTTFASVEQHPIALTACFVALSAALSAVMSNTATATLLVPMAVALDPQPPTLPILVALAASFGMPFVISTPPNAMVVGKDVRSSDLLFIGTLIMLLGCFLLSLTGPWILAQFFK
jgi:sodium-dependent dicarboxylate transporter 2/3/5